MAKTLLCLPYFLLAVIYAYGQDIITRSDGVEIKATALEITSTLITFKRFASSDTLVYQISPQDVQSIKMADGTVKHFTPAAAPKETPAFNYEKDLGRNILWYLPFDLIFSNFALAYERILTSGKVGFKIPVVIGLNTANDNNTYNDFRRNNRFGAGLEVNFYPFGQGRIQYYYGPAFYFRSFESYYYYYPDPDPTDPFPTSSVENQNAGMFTAAIKNGMYYQFSKAFLFSVDVGLGYRFFQLPAIPNTYYPEDRNRFYVPANLQVGLRF